jgi:exodeoxyribonuclease VIII
MNCPEEGTYFDMPAEVYHAAPAVSKSLLWEFHEAATPLHFHKREPKVATADMQFGTVCHAAILQSELLHQSYHLKPEQYPSTPKATKANPNPAPEMKKWNGNADWCEKWIKEHSDRPILSRDQVDKIPKIAERVRALKEFGSALKHGQTEVSFFKRDEETGLMLKCRCDLMATTTSSETWIFDPKKVQPGEANQSAFEKQAYNLGYHMQSESYLKITGASRFIFVPFDDSEPFDACQYEPDSEMRAEGYREWRRLLLAYAKCVKEDHWPGYHQGVAKMTLPNFAKRSTS